MNMNILVIGAGMYVCGKGTDGFGTIIPTLAEISRTNPQINVFLAATSPQSINIFKSKLDAINKYMGTNLHVSCEPESHNSPQAYLDIAHKLKGPSCAIVCTPDHLHYDITKNLLNLKIPTLVVKPLTPTVNEALDLIKIQKEQNVYGAIEFHKRFDKANQILKEVVQTNRIGTPLYFLVEYSQRKEIPETIFRSWVESSNIFQYLGVHYIDIIYFATKAKPLTVTALGQKTYLKTKGINAYDSIQALIEWEMPNGARFTSTILTNWIDPKTTSAMSDQKIKLIGTHGRYESDQKNRGIEIIDNNSIESINPDFCRFYSNGTFNQIKGYGVDSITSFINDVIDLSEGRTTIAELEKCRPSFKESLVSTSVIEAVKTSLYKNGEKIEIAIY